MRVLLDTNILISAFLGSQKEIRLVRAVAFGAGKTELVVPWEIVSELRAVLQEKFRAKPGVAEFVRFFEGLLADPRRGWRLPVGGDEAILAAARRLEADLIVTGDRALLHRKQFADIPIVRTADALRILGVYHR